MKLFPTKNYEFEVADYLKAIYVLKENTFITDSLVSEWTKKAFIGQVGENGFKIISATSGRGSFSVFTGTLESKSGNLEIRIHRAFRIMLLIIYSFPIIGFTIALLTKEKDLIISLILPTLMSLIIFRFVFTELAFRFISNEGLKKLINVMEITNLKKK